MKIVNHAIYPINKIQMTLVVLLVFAGKIGQKSHFIGHLRFVPKQKQHCDLTVN